MVSRDIFTEFKSMLRDCEGEIPKLTRLLRNRLSLNQEALGVLTGLHRNAIIRLENGRCDTLVKWVRELFFVLLVCRDRTLSNDLLALREYAKRKTLMGSTQENSGRFKDFLRLFAASGQNIAELSKTIRKEYNLTQEELAGLLWADRSAVGHLEANKYKYPERLLADLYLSFLQLNDPELKEYVLALTQEKIKRTWSDKADKEPAIEIRPEEPETRQLNANEPEAKYPERTDRPMALAGENEVSVPGGGLESPPPVSAPKLDNFDEQAKLRRYGFRTKQELDNAIRSAELTLEEKRRLAMIDVLWNDDLKKKETLKFVRTQMQTVKAKILRELFERTGDDQVVFLRAANSYRKGLSIAEIAQENYGYLSLPFCRLWERLGFDLAKYLVWKPSDSEVYEIYKDYEPEFKTKSLEYRFRPKKNPPAQIEGKDKNLNSLLKEWFPLIAEEIGD